MRSGFTTQVIPSQVVVRRPQSDSQQKAMDEILDEVRGREGIEPTLVLVDE